MNKQASLALAVSLLFMGVTAYLLRDMQINQRLGTPGLKVVAEPIHDPEGKVVGTNSVYLPSWVLDYESKATPVTTLELEWLPKDTVFGRRVYKATDGFESMISIVLMGADRTSIHKPEYCLYGQGWVIEQQEEITVAMDRPIRYDLPVKKLTTARKQKLADGREVELRGIYLYWFVADGQFTADHNERMWWMARDLIKTGVLQRWAYVTYFSVCLPGQEEATLQRMKKFVAASAPDFQLVPEADKPYNQPLLADKH